MYNSIMDAVTRQLHELFGDDYEIYTDAVEQGLMEPCFFVQFLEPSEKPMIGCRYYRQTSICIQYLPGEPEQIRRELNRAAALLMEGMEYITLENGDLLRGTSRRHRTEDGVLSFFVEFNMFVNRTAYRNEPMDGLETHAELRRQ